MRVTQTQLLRSALFELQRQRSRLAELQEQASTGLRINRPSDDPVGLGAASVLRDAIRAADQLLENQDRAGERLRATENALDGAMNVLIRAKEAAIQGANDVLSAADRQALAAEVEAMHDEMVALANTRLSRAYLFAGYANDAAPFAATGPFTSGSPPPAVVWSGDASEIQVEVDDGVFVSSTLDGQRVFQGGDDVFGVLGQLWEALDTDDPVATAAAIDAIDRAHLQVSLERTRLGAIGNRLESARTSVESQRLGAVERLSATEDADAFEVFSQLVQQESALQAALSATARVLQPTLLDFLS